MSGWKENGRGVLPYDPSRSIDHDGIVGPDVVRVKIKLSVIGLVPFLIALAGDL
jgi:hypothetical protein